MHPSFQRRLESRGHSPFEQGVQPAWNLSILLPALRVDRALHLSTLSTLRRSAQGHGLLPATSEQGAHRFQKSGAGAIDQTYGWASSYRRGLWVLRVRRSCNQRTRTPLDRDRGGCQWWGRWGGRVESRSPTTDTRLFRTSGQGCQPTQARIPVPAPRLPKHRTAGSPCTVNQNFRGPKWR